MLLAFLFCRCRRVLFCSLFVYLGMSIINHISETQSCKWSKCENVFFFFLCMCAACWLIILCHYCFVLSHVWSNDSCGSHNKTRLLFCSMVLGPQKQTSKTCFDREAVSTDTELSLCTECLVSSPLPSWNLTWPPALSTSACLITA